jgi:pSer/pThr/pTyr-binding forkhead associated (FHA) protein
MAPSPDQPSTAQPLTPVRLRYRRQELLLATGSYLLGRDPTCHVVIDRPLVSRRHARLGVEGHRVTVEDLGSMNGVFVNGARVNGSRALFDGDWITIGSEELELAIGDGTRNRIPVETQADPEAVRPSSDQDFVRMTASPPRDEHPTERSRTLEILTSIADRAFEAGRVQDAEDMLKLTLVDLLQDATSGQTLEQDAREFAVRHGLKLAQAGRSTRWFDYVIDLLRAERTPCSEELARDLKKTMDRLGNVDLERLKAYAGSLRTLTTDLESLRSGQRVEELVRSAQAARR